MPLYRRDNGRFIYALLDPRDGTVRYVGCAIDVEKPTGYATSEPKGGENPEKLAKTAEMCLPERKRVRKGGEEDD